MEKVIYISRVCSNEMFDRLMKKGKVLHQPAQKFHRLMIEGLRDNGMKVRCISSLPIQLEEKSFSNKIVEEINNIKFLYSSSSNNKLLNRLIIFIFSFMQTFKEIKKDNTFIISDVLDISLAMGSLIAAKLGKCDYIALITDLPEDLSSNKMYILLCKYIIKHSDKYIFLSEHMNKKINSKCREYIVIEGMVDNKTEKGIIQKKSLNFSDKKRICMYAGALEEKYGVKMMIDAFVSLKNPDYILYIYGYGSLEEYIKKIIKDNKNIIYFGLVSNDEIIKMEREVNLLINPRPSNASFTLFSFPSKNMEYLVSGTPIFCAKLGCIPNEYDPYCFYFMDETFNGFKNKLQEILSKNVSDLDLFGKNAKDWVLKNKNNVVQSRKILIMEKVVK